MVRPWPFGRLVSHESRCEVKTASGLTSLSREPLELVDGEWGCE